MWRLYQSHISRSVCRQADIFPQTTTESRQNAYLKPRNAFVKANASLYNQSPTFGSLKNVFPFGLGKIKKFGGYMDKLIPRSCSH